MFTDPATRQTFKIAFREPRSSIEHMGYGLYVGKVPEG
jgi:hypothetical protein